MNPRRTFLQQVSWSFGLLVASGGGFAQSQPAKPLRVVLRGHDPVAYFTDSKPVKGDPKISHDWDGERYLFATASNREKFVADPERYAPQFGGYCTGTMAKGARAEADPEAWIITDGRLYVFGQVKFRDMAAQDQRWLAEKIAAAKQNWRATH